MVAGDCFSNYAWLELFRWQGESGKIIGQGVSFIRGPASPPGFQLTARNNSPCRSALGPAFGLNERRPEMIPCAIPSASGAV